MKKRIDGLEVNYIDEGTGRPLVFLHGWGTSAANMWPLAEAFSERHRVIVLDFPGFGESVRPEATWKVMDYAQFLVKFLAELGIERPHALIGHSFGGRVSIKALGTGLLESDKLILIDSAGVKPSDSMRKLAYKLIAKSGKAALSAPGLRRFSSKARAKLYESAGSTDYMNAEGMRDILIATVGEDLKENAKTITVPTLIVWGSEDKETPLSDARFFHTASAGSQLKIIQGAGHFAHTDAPRKVARFMREFLG